MLKNIPKLMPPELMKIMMQLPPNQFGKVCLPYEQIIGVSQARAQANLLGKVEKNQGRACEMFTMVDIFPIT